MAKANVTIGTPCYGGLVTATYTSSLIDLHRAAPSMGIAVNTAFVAGDALITRARSLTVAAFMDQPLATHLMFIDADTGFRPEQIKRMIDLDEDIVGALCPAKQIDWPHLDANRLAGEPLEQAGLIYVGTPCSGPALKTRQGFATAEYVGTGFMLVKRRVFERMFEAYPDLKFSAIDSNLKVSKTDQNLYAVFDCLIEPVTRKYLSEDYSFCLRWKQLGGEIWIDLESELVHVGPTAYRGNSKIRYARLHKPV